MTPDNRPEDPHDEERPEFTPLSSGPDASTPPDSDAPPWEQSAIPREDWGDAHTPEEAEAQAQSVHDPVADEDVTEELDVAHSPKTRKTLGLAVAAALALGLLLTAIYYGLPQPTDEGILTGVVADEAQVLSEEPEITERIFRFAEIDLHPEVVHRDLFGPQIGSEEGSSRLARFREFLSRYEARMAEDDNFTVRVLDDRNGKVLEVYTLEDARRKHEASGQPLDPGQSYWSQIDQQRRQATNELVRKWSSTVPRQHITVKWGRKNQVLGARDRDAPYLFYEMKLARMMGLSLLSTEIGTQETFNQDWLVSSVGARSRYQLMPDIMQRFDIYQYGLKTVAGNTVSVKEEQNPLLAMQPYFTLLTGYSNAVGNELPGISSYHAGPGNIMTIYVRYLRNVGLQPGDRVTDAYMWGITDGFATVTKGTSFGKFSREYVASIAGAFRGTEDLEIDPTDAVRAERVMMRPGREATLSQLLAALDGADVQWGPYATQESLYERFRLLNPHIDLPESQFGTVPRNGDLVFTRKAGGRDVHFFLPLGATDVLASNNWLDPDATWKFDEHTYDAPAVSGEETQWDREYRALIADIESWGFTNANRSKLERLYNKFQELEAQNPTTYRKMQAEIIKIHRQVWQTSLFNILKDEATQQRARLGTAASP